MRGLNLAVLLLGLTLVGAALYGVRGLDGSLELAASHAAPAHHGPCNHHDGEFTTGV